jgi:hypothetical protein
MAAEVTTTGILKGQLLSLDDLTPFQERWVALREGRVIDSDVDPVTLCDRVTETDDLFFVPSDDIDLIF